MPTAAACDECGWKGTVNSSVAGSKSKCPSCGEPMFVEDPDEIRRKRAALAEGGDHSPQPGRSVSGGAGIGILMMVGAVVWFVVGLVVIDRIFIYPFVLFVLGLIQLVRSLAGRPN